MKRSLRKNPIFWMFLIVLFLSLACIRQSLSFQLDADGSMLVTITNTQLYVPRDDGELSNDLKRNIQQWQDLGWIVQEPDIEATRATLVIQKQVTAGDDESFAQLSRMLTFTDTTHPKPTRISYIAQENLSGARNYKFIISTLNLAGFKNAWQELKKERDKALRDGRQIECSSLDAYSKFFTNISGAKPKVEEVGAGKCQITAEEIKRWRDQLNDPLADQPFTVEIRVSLPEGASINRKDTTGWDSIDDTSPATNVVYIWDAENDPPVVSNLKVEADLHPKPEDIDDKTLERNFDELIRLFEIRIPQGPFWTDPSYRNSAAVNSLALYYSPGQIHNRFAPWVGDDFTCGGYQKQTLVFFDQIRFNPDESHLLDGLVYAPIRGWGGGHQAVLIWKYGADPWKTGWVFDPWPNQIPEVYDFNEWKKSYPGTGPSKVWRAAELWPHIDGKHPAYPDTTTGFVKNLGWRRIVVESPVWAMVVSDDGQMQVGFDAQGEFVYEMPAEIGRIDFYAFPKPDGSNSYYFGLPEAADGYELRLTGTNDGEVQVMVGAEEAWVSYGAQVIKAGELMTVPVLEAFTETPMQLPDGNTISPIKILPEPLQASEQDVKGFFPTPVEPESEESVELDEPPSQEVVSAQPDTSEVNQGSDQPASGTDFNLSFGVLMIVAGLLLLGALGVFLIGAVYWLRRQK